MTANRAAVEDKVIAPGEAVPNDYYVRDEGHRLLTYLVPTRARVTVITNGSRGFRATPVPVAELALILEGENPKNRRLYSLRLGFWGACRIGHDPLARPAVSAVAGAVRIPRAPTAFRRAHETDFQKYVVSHGRPSG
jgi:hypothetical protein